MNVLLADQQVDARDGEHDDKKNDRRGRGIGGEAAAVAVEHIVNVADDGVHLCGVEVGAEERDGVAIRLESADKARDDEVKERGRDHREGDLCEHSPLCGAVNARGVVIILIDRGEGTGQYQNLERHNDPDGIDAENEHLCPVWTFDKIDRGAAEKVDKQIHHSVGVRSFLEKDHKNESDREGVGDVRKEINRLEKLAELFNRSKRNRDDKRESRRHRHGDDNENEGVLHRLQEIGIAQYVLIIIKSRAEKGLRRRVVALLEGVNEHVDERVDHKYAQKQNGGKQIEPRLKVVVFQNRTSQNEIHNKYTTKWLFCKDYFPKKVEKGIDSPHFSVDRSLI